MSEKGKGGRVFVAEGGRQRREERISEGRW